MSGTVQIVEPPQQMPQRQRQRRHTAFWRKILFMFVLVGIVGFGGFCGYTHTTPVQAMQLLAMGAGMLKEKVHPIPPFKGLKQVNILVLGADVSFDGSGAARTDTIKVVRVDLHKGKERISILSIPRDTWVSVPGHGHGRINSAYQFGGRREIDRIAMAKKTIGQFLQELTGEEITFHRYVRVQPGGFVKVVDALGGVEIDVEKQMDYEDPSQRLYIHLKPGRQRLMGKDAMGYVRFRMDKNGDYGRIARQDKFVHALVAQLGRPEEKKKLPRLLGPMMSMVVTDMQVRDLKALKGIVDKVGMSGVHTAQLPTVPCRKGRAQVVEVDDPVLAAQTLAEVLHGPRPTVVVLNGSGRTGLGREVSMAIDSKRYNVVAVGTTTEPAPTSTVITAENQKQDAMQLATTVGVSAVDTETPVPTAKFDKRTPEPPPAQITIVLGSDYTSLPMATAQGQ